jgi:hypothetical protein
VRPISVKRDATPWLDGSPNWAILHQAGIGLFVPAIHETGRKQEDHLRPGYALAGATDGGQQLAIAFSFLAVWLIRWLVPSLGLHRTAYWLVANC